MPIASGARGRVNTLVAPSGGFRGRRYSGESISPPMPGGGFKARTEDSEDSLGRLLPFRSRPFSTLSKYVTGVAMTRTNLTPLAGATVHLFRTADDAEVDQQTTAADGSFTLTCAGSGTFWLKGETTDGSAFGCTINTVTTETCAVSLYLGDGTAPVRSYTPGAAQGPLSSGQPQTGRLTTYGR